MIATWNVVGLQLKLTFWILDAYLSASSSENWKDDKSYKKHVKESIM